MPPGLYRGYGCIWPKKGLFLKCPKWSSFAAVFGGRLSFAERRIVAPDSRRKPENPRFFENRQNRQIDESIDDTTVILCHDGGTQSLLWRSLREVPYVVRMVPSGIPEGLDAYLGLFWLCFCSFCT
jgi:hypothetical protein